MIRFRLTRSGPVRLPGSPACAVPPVAERGARTLAGAAAEEGPRAGGMGGRRVLVHASGFRQSPYADVRPPGDDPRAARRMARSGEPDDPQDGAQGAPHPGDAPADGSAEGLVDGSGGAPPPRRLWHASPGSAGR